MKKNNLFVGLISIIFFLSGYASLIYQVVWQRLLSSHYGVGSISTALIVGIYMAGLGLGGLLGGFLAERLSQKIKFYLILELAIGIFGIFSLPFLELLGNLTAGSDLTVSAVWMFLFLCIPTLLMGITLPVLTKIFNQHIHNFDKTVSYLYFINTIGASVGAITTSYILISFFGLDTATYIAVLIDVFLAVLVFILGKLINTLPELITISNVNQQKMRGLGKLAFILVGITGFLAIGYEIIWYRFIGVLIKDSPYAFSSILSVYLFGLALGSLGMNRLLSFKPELNKKKWFFIFQFLIGVYILISFTGFYYLTQNTIFGKLVHASFSIESHPDPLKILMEWGKLSKSLTFMSLLDVFFWPAFFLLIPTLLMGASFPLAASLALIDPNKEGKTVGTLYFFNIVGNVLGSIVTSFLILPNLGTEVTLFIFSMVNISLIIFTSQPKIFISIFSRAALIGVTMILGWIWFPKASQLYFLIHPNEGKMYFEEGMDSVVITYRLKDIDRNFINGLEHGLSNNTIYNSWIVDSLSYANSLDDILIIGYGIGTFPEIALKVPEAKRITLVELSPTLIKNVNKIDDYLNINTNPKLSLIIDDGRRYLLANPQKYDLIIMDPVRSTTAYANNLHSYEFLQLVKSRLKPGGIVFLGGMKESQILPKTFASVFPYVRIYYYCAIGSEEPLIDNTLRREKILALFPPDRSRRIPLYLRSTYKGDQKYALNLQPVTSINRLYKPNTEYYLGYQLREYFQK